MVGELVEARAEVQDTTTSHTISVLQHNEFNGNSSTVGCFLSLFSDAVVSAGRGLLHRVFFGGVLETDEDISTVFK